MTEQSPDNPASIPTGIGADRALVAADFRFDALVEELSMQALELRAQGNTNDADLMDRAADALASYSGDAE